MSNKAKEIHRQIAKLKEQLAVVEGQPNWKQLEVFTVMEKCDAFDKIYALALRIAHGIVESGRWGADDVYYLCELAMKCTLGNDIFKTLRRFT